MLKIGTNDFEQILLPLFVYSSKQNISVEILPKKLIQKLLVKKRKLIICAIINDGHGTFRCFPNHSVTIIFFYLQFVM